MNYQSANKLFSSYINALPTVLWCNYRSQATTRLISSRSVNLLAARREQNKWERLLRVRLATSSASRTGRSWLQLRWYLRMAASRCQMLNSGHRMSAKYMQLQDAYNTLFNHTDSQTHYLFLCTIQIQALYFSRKSTTEDLLT